MILGANKSRVSAIGPQIGHLFPLGDKQGYLNLKGYWEFECLAPGRRLERVALVCDLAGRTALPYYRGPGWPGNPPTVTMHWVVK